MDRARVRDKILNQSGINLSDLPSKCSYDIDLETTSWYSLFCPVVL
jgi:hypothetical protein